VSLAYCRTIHKAQGSTYRGESFTLAGDDTIHLEALHVALSRGTQANHLYYTGEPPPHEDHHLPAAGEQPALESLVAAAGRSRAKVMALDLLEAPLPREAGADDVRTQRRRQREASIDAIPAATPTEPAVAAVAAVAAAAAAAAANRGPARLRP